MAMEFSLRASMASPIALIYFLKKSSIIFKHCKYTFTIGKIELMLVLIFKCPKKGGGDGWELERVSGPRRVIAKPRKEVSWLLVNSVSHSQSIPFVSMSRVGGQIYPPANVVGFWGPVSVMKGNVNLLKGAKETFRLKCPWVGQVAMTFLDFYSNGLFSDTNFVIKVQNNSSNHMVTLWINQFFSPKVVFIRLLRNIWIRIELHFSSSGHGFSFVHWILWYFNGSFVDLNG